MKGFPKNRLLILFALSLIMAFFPAAGGCLGDLTTSDEGGTDDSGQPTLTDGDFPDDTLCSDRDTLPTDTAFLDVITNATQVIHIHKEYTDDDELPAVCGLSDEDNTLEVTETAWDPSEGNDVEICYTFAEDLLTLFSIEGTPPGICRSNYEIETENTADGFPRAGTYRIDTCIEEGGSSYRVRVRVKVSGTNVNKTLTQAGVTDVTDLGIFDEDGTEVTASDAAKELFTENPGGFTFTVRSGDGATTHLTVTVQVICVNKTSSCPTPTEACS